LIALEQAVDHKIIDGCAIRRRWQAVSAFQENWAKCFGMWEKKYLIFCNRFFELSITANSEAENA
jgi:hypothetical protein